MSKKTYPKIQQEVKELYEHNEWKTEPTLLILAMVEELGELAGRWLAEHPGYRKSLKKTDPIPEEIGDLLNLILAFCNTQNINFEDCVRKTIKKRLEQKDHWKTPHNPDI
ncbi:MAG: MazG nucleotide pyrophosphohydrolase domain-containing protein [Patescibacteria group bacterium]